MRIIHELARTDRRARALVVLLPGAMQQPENLLQAGFAAAVRERSLPMDLALVDFGLQFIGESTDGSAVRLLHESLLQSLAVHRYEEIWLAGISIGGSIAVAYIDTYARTHPGLIDGLCLLAPYPGNRMVTNAIRRAGGVARWTPDEAGDIEDTDFRLWRWLKTYQGNGPKLYLAYGLQDRFAPGLALMAEALDARCVATAAGGHDLTTWQQLWENFLGRLALRPDRNPDRS
jgi:hypothetical protein